MKHKHEEQLHQEICFIDIELSTLKKSATKTEHITTTKRKERSLLQELESHHMARIHELETRKKEIHHEIARRKQEQAHAKKTKRTVLVGTCFIILFILLLGFSLHGPQSALTGAVVGIQGLPSTSVAINGNSTFTSDQTPSFSFELTTQTAVGLFANDAPTRKMLQVRLVDPQGVETILKEQTIESGHTFSVDLGASRSVRPGEYTIKVLMAPAQDAGVGIFNEQNVEAIYEQDFSWGVLAINTHKATYFENETANIGIAVLNSSGSMVCDANVTLTITNPQGEIATLSTQLGSIHVSDECEVYGVTTLPDYYTTYQTSSNGTYSMNLTAQSVEGVKSILDSFEVAQNIEFDVSRDAATRIYPLVNYSTTISINANQDYVGQIIEYVPALFEISSQPGLLVTTQNDTKVLAWDVNLSSGEKINLSYEYDAADISPYLYITGPLEIGEWQEARTWKIASDAVVESGVTRLTINDSITPTFVNTNTSATFYAYYQNITSMQHITGANCTVNFDDVILNQQMSENVDHYTYTKTQGFSSSGVHNWNVTCNKAGFVELTALETINVSNIPTTPLLVSPSAGLHLTNRTPLLIWNNSQSPLTTTYEVLIDDNPSFNNPELNVLSISNTTSTNTSFVTSTELDVDTTYYWKVRANTSEGYSTYSESQNFTIDSYLALTVLASNVNFGAMNADQSKNTTTGNPTPFRVENVGNILANVTVSATPYFNSVAYPSLHYQFKIRENESNAFNTTLSSLTWQNMSNSSSNAHVVNLDWHVFKNDFLTDLLVVIPTQEGSGTRNSTVTFEAIS